jgi:hypothetical protein
MKILKVLAAIVVFFLTYFVYLLLAAPVWNLFFFSKTEPPPIAARIAIYLLALILPVATSRRIIKRYFDLE